jgi:hypothetical protein
LGRTGVRPDVLLTPGDRLLTNSSPRAIRCVRLIRYSNPLTAPRPVHAIRFTNPLCPFNPLTAIRFTNPLCPFNPLPKAIR